MGLCFIVGTNDVNNAIITDDGDGTITIDSEFPQGPGTKTLNLSNIER